MKLHVIVTTQNDDEVSIQLFKNKKSAINEFLSCLSESEYKPPKIYKYGAYFESDDGNVKMDLTFDVTVVEE